MENTKRKAWIGALRLRTLPLAAGGIILGTFLPETAEKFSWLIFILALLTAFGLQVLSNLANDYGDFIKGTDNENRVGPTRALQSGLITKEEMKRALIACTLITLISGLLLLFFAFGKADFAKSTGMLVVGLAAIWAAIKYTVGKSAYGYHGLGDVFVIIFFGPVSVAGVSFLYLHEINIPALLPAFSYGLLASGVLNINNMRDIENDRASGKNTLVVKIGPWAARLYHFMLITCAFMCLCIYLLITRKSSVEWLSLLAFTPIFINTYQVLKPKKDPSGYNPLLKGLAISSLLMVIAFTLLLKLF